MSTPTAAFLLPLVGYLSGSIRPAHILARRGGLDFRVIGKNPGTAETFRHFGFWPAVLVYVLDATKALLPLIAGNLLRVPGWSLVLTAAAAVAGHNWSLYYRFWGGKGLATASGALLFLLPLNFSIALIPALLAWRRTGWVPGSGGGRGHRALHPPAQRDPVARRPRHDHDGIVPGDGARHLRPADLVDRFCHRVGGPCGRLHAHQPPALIDADGVLLKRARQAARRGRRR